MYLHKFIYTNVYFIYHKLPININAQIHTCKYKNTCKHIFIHAYLFMNIYVYNSYRCIYKYYYKHI